MSFEKVLFVIAVLGVTATGGWWWQQRAVLARVAAEPVAAVLSGDRYTSQTISPLRLAPKPWPKPGAQSHGPGWVYEVFTPPVIYYHALARSFAVTPPLGTGRNEAAFGLELLDVGREPYRLQLVGYVGAPGDYIAAFVSPKDPATLLARTGRRFDELGLVFHDFTVRKVPATPGDAMSPLELAAIATVRDEQTGELVELHSRQRKFTDTPIARLRFGQDAKLREFREGEIFHDGAVVYRIERIQLEPPEVLVARETLGLPDPETRVLRPAATGEIAPKGAKSATRFESRMQPVVSAEVRP